MILFGRGGFLGVVIGWTAAALMAVAFVVIYVTLTGLYALWLVSLACYRAVRRR